jgi:hypothetical protein
MVPPALFCRLEIKFYFAEKSSRLDLGVSSLLPKPESRFALEEIEPWMAESRERPLSWG